LPRNLIELHFPVFDQDKRAQQNRNLRQTGCVNHLVSVDRSHPWPLWIGDIHETHAELPALYGVGKFQLPKRPFEPLLQSGIEAVTQARITRIGTQSRSYPGQQNEAQN